MVGSGRLRRSLLRGIGLSGGLVGRTCSNEGGSHRRGCPVQCPAVDVGWEGILQHFIDDQCSGDVPRAQQSEHLVPATMIDRRRWIVHSASADYSSTCCGCFPNGHLPSSDLATVVAHLPSLGHVAVVVAAAAAAGNPTRYRGIPMGILFHGNLLEPHGIPRDTPGIR